MNLATTARTFIAAGILVCCVPLRAAWAPLGPFGGSASVVVADPHSPGTFLAGSPNGLLFRSSDGGESWTPLPFPPQLRATLNTLAIDPQTRGVYLAGLSSDLAQYSGILRSADGGASWVQVPDLRNQQVRAIAFKRNTVGIVAAGTDSGVFASADGGVTWRRISPEDNDQLRPVMSVTFDPKDSATLYAGTPHLPWKTSDEGASWQSIHTGMFDDSDIFSIQVDRNRPQRVFAGACSGIYRSLNGGAAWTRRVEVKETNNRTYVIAQDPQYENIWFAGTSEGLVRSLDGGVHWLKLARYSTRAIAFDPHRLGRVFIATDSSGILRSDDDGESWQPANNGFCNRRLGSLWTIGGELYTTALDSPTSANILQLAPDLSQWLGITKVEGMPFVPTDVVLPPWDPRLVLARSENGLFLSEDRGRNWNPLELPVRDGGISTISILKAPWIAAAGLGGLFLSRDGRNWIPCPVAAGQVYGIAWTQNNSLLAATSSGLRGSDNLGVSWYSVRGEFERDSIQAIVRHPSRYLWFAAKYGVIYSSDNAGRTWSRVSPEGWPVSSVKQIMVVPGRVDRLLVLTHQQGVWLLSLETDRPRRQAP